MKFFGVDPGRSGAIACITDDGKLSFMRLDETLHDIWEWLEYSSIMTSRCVIERVSAHPKQGVSSTFKFGWSAGFAEGLIVAASIPYELVTPAKWQTAMKCRSGGDKNITKQAAQRLFPAAKITHHTADAILLAEYCRREMA